MSSTFSHLQCKNPGCLKIFCRQHSCPETENRVEEVLEKYGNLFSCENVEKLISNPPATTVYENDIINLYFYLVDLVYKKDYYTTSQFCSPKAFTFQKSKTLKLKNGLAKKRNKMEARISPCHDLEHSYCQIGHSKLSHVDSYFLIGVLHLILCKFQVSQDLTVALVIIRLFCTISPHSYIDDCYYPQLLCVFNFVYLSIVNSIIKSNRNEIYRCGPCRCLFQSTFTKIDFTKSLESIMHLLNSATTADFREEKTNKVLCDIHLLLYRINSFYKFTDYENFYCEKLSSLINLKEELRYLKLKTNSILQYKHILPVTVKAEFLKVANTDIQKTTLQDSFFRALFEGLTEPYLFITIRREYIYSDTLKILGQIPESDLKKQLKINFVNEDGIDSGGIRKEYFQLLSHEITHDESIFAIKNERVWLKPGVDLVKLKIIGKIIGIALYNDVVLNIPFASLFFKKILSYKLTFDDLVEIESEYYTSLKNLDEASSDVFDCLDMYFVAFYEVGGEMKSMPLVLDGEQIKVDRTNYSCFKKMFSQFYMSKLIVNEFTELLDGFYSVIDSGSIQSFQPKELEKIIMGIDDFNFDAIKESTQYQGYTMDAKVIKDFWRIVESYSEENKKKFLRFVTGNDRIPIGGPETLKLTIMKNGCDTERLPSSQTCFNTLLLPEYVTYQKLQNKLSTAIEMTAGFYLM